MAAKEGWCGLCMLRQWAGVGWVSAVHEGQCVGSLSALRLPKQGRNPQKQMHDVTGQVMQEPMCLHVEVSSVEGDRSKCAVLCGREFTTRVRVGGGGGGERLSGKREGKLR